MIDVLNVRLSLDEGIPGSEGPKKAAARALGIPKGRVASVRVLKRSVDARKKRDVHFVANLGVELLGGAQEEGEVLSRHAAASNVRAHRPYEPLSIPDCAGTAGSEGFLRPVVVGTGPAGLFAAVYLARAGLRPLVLERGGDVEERSRDVASFNEGGPLDPESNVQFGEGGAGTFSDGKLTTNTKNPRTAHVLRWFVDAGAPEEILWQAHPHIGSDNLPRVVAALRNEVVERGGEVRFHCRMDALSMEDGLLSGLEVTDLAAGRKEFVETRCAILACGHSARDVFASCLDAGLPLERKPFAMGVRIEHPQELVNRAQWGAASEHAALGAAEYKLAVHLPSGRGVYTFCMCPGGEVVCAASEEGGVVVNGMSNFARDGRNANSALLVGLDPDDFGEEGGVLAGVEFQRRLERAAYRAGSCAGAYKAPAQTVEGFLAHRAGERSRTVEPTYARGVAWCDLREVLPEFMADAIEEALPLLDRKLHGFADGQAVMTGVETRSSSPVRMLRREDFQACADGARRSGVFPCGEGAGYAGGIMSAAVDGLRCAEALAAWMQEGMPREYC